MQNTGLVASYDTRPGNEMRWANSTTLPSPHPMLLQLPTQTWGLITNQPIQAQYRQLRRRRNKLLCSTVSVNLEHETNNKTAVNH